MPIVCARCFWAVTTSNLPRGSVQITCTWNLPQTLLCKANWAGDVLNIRDPRCPFLSRSFACLYKNRRSGLQRRRSSWHGYCMNWKYKHPLPIKIECMANLANRPALQQCQTSCQAGLVRTLHPGPLVLRSAIETLHSTSILWLHESIYLRHVVIRARGSS